MAEPLVVGLDEVDATQGALAGGKGANLGELTRLDGVRVPPGFCVTTHAFRQVMAAAPAAGGDLPRLRAAVEALPVPDELVSAITRAVTRHGEQAGYAVRSSATAEDLPTASFAGQQDSYLGVVGVGAVVRHVRRCWASLFTERAVAYRRRAGIDDRDVSMAVVVQRMVDPRVSGVLFTADPVTGDRRVVAIEAVRGLGDALVGGLADPEVHRVRDGCVVPSEAGGGEPLLTAQQVHGLARLGRRIEAHFGRPQDIEWCLDDEGCFHVVQARPVTTVFPVPVPVPAPAGDPAPAGGNRVYISVGHQQMMTDAMKPLGLSFWQLTTPAPMAEAGGRLFVDVNPRLVAPADRAAILDALERSDPLIGDALRILLDRDGFIEPVVTDDPPRPLFGSTGEPVETDAAIVTELIDRTQASIAEAEHAIATLSGEALTDFIRADLQELRWLLFDRRGYQVFMSAMEAVQWLNDHLREWLGETNAADTLTRSVPHNVTSEMGLALLDVADAVRRHPEVVTFLEGVGDDDGFLDRLPTLPGGREVRGAVLAWLEKYGMRCPGEIDITRPRWSEHPSALLPAILGNVRNFEDGAAARRFERGLEEARAKEREVLARLRALPDGDAKAEQVKQRIDRVRTFIGYREYPKYGMVCRYFVYKRALLAEAGRLVRDGVLDQPDDVFFLRFDELEDAVRTRRVDRDLLRERKAAFREHQALTPPRVITSDGEIVAGRYRQDDVPDGALAGLAVSAGVVEGRARVVLDPAAADLEPGDILVTAFTDPSWTPLFLAVAGLVTEVGGLMTHGAVIAREYGLPAVVGVVDATRLIPDGARVRVHGTAGYVELLA